MKTIVIHHSADYDGIFCREIARKFLPDAELIGWDFGDALIPFPKEGQVYILDLSADCIQASDIPDDWKTRTVWIDHHKTSMEKWSEDIPGYRIDGVAACRLAWQWFQIPTGRFDGDIKGEIEGRKITNFSLPTKLDFIDRNVSEPWAVRLAGEYDIWDKRDPDAELLQHGLRSQELYSSEWDEMLNEEKPGSSTVVRLLNQGRALQYAKTKENESIIKNIGFTWCWEGLLFLCCNHASYNSHLFTAGLKPEHEACFGFKWTGKDWSISLYHAPGHEQHDLSEIAKKFGGGGHRGACGFRTNKLPFIP